MAQRRRITKFKVNIRAEKDRGRLRRDTRGNKYWVAHYSDPYSDDPNPQKRRCSQALGFMTVEEAEDRAEELRASVILRATSGSPSPAPAPKAEPEPLPLVGAAATMWLATVKGSDSYLKTQRRAVGWITHHLGDLCISKLQSDDAIADYVDARYHDVSEHTGRRPARATILDGGGEVATLRRFLRWCQRKGWVSNVPEKPKARWWKNDARPPRNALEEEVLDFARRCWEHYPPLGALIVVLSLTPRRPTPLLKLRERDVDIFRNRIRLHEDKTTMDVGWLDLAPQAVEAIKAVMEGNPGGYVFRNREGGRWTIESLDHTILDLCKRWKMGNPILPYDLRKYAINTLFDRGANPKEVQKLAGHLSLATTLRHYASARPQRCRDLMDSMILEGDPILPALAWAASDKEDG